MFGAACSRGGGGAPCWCGVPLALSGDWLLPAMTPSLADTPPGVVQLCDETYDSVRESEAMTAWWEVAGFWPGDAPSIVRHGAGRLRHASLTYAA